MRPNSLIRSGSAPDDLRKSFIEAVDFFVNIEDGEFESDENFRGRKLTLGQLAGLLWNCTDIMPIALRGDIGVLAEQVTDEDESRWRHEKRTFAQGARLVRLYLNAKATPQPGDATV